MSLFMMMYNIMSECKIYKILHFSINLKIGLHVVSKLFNLHKQNQVSLFHQYEKFSFIC
jgi:hypothetical protein